MKECEFTVSSFYDYLSNENLMGSECEECRARMIPPRSICLRCGSSNLKWFKSSGEGTLQTFTVIHVPPTFLSDKAPYLVGIVKVEEGPSVTSRILNIDPNTPDKIKLGMKMRFAPFKDKNQWTIAFKPDSFYKTRKPKLVMRQ